MSVKAYRPMWNERLQHMCQFRTDRLTRRAKPVLIDLDSPVEVVTVTLSQLSPYAENLKSNNFVSLLRMSAWYFGVSSLGGPKTVFPKKQASLLPIGLDSISNSRHVRAGFRPISRGPIANSKATYKDIHGKSYQLRNVSSSSLSRSGTPGVLPPPRIPRTRT
jgi:hypothetical protein